MAKIRVGLAGCGFVSELHMHAYRRVYGVDVEVRAVAARGDHVVEFARRHQIPTAYRSFGDLIADADIDVIDICTPVSTSSAKSRSPAISAGTAIMLRSASMCPRH